MIKITFLMLKNIILSRNFPICCVCVFLLCFSAAVGTNYATGDPLSVASYIIGSAENPPGVNDVLNTRGGSWLLMFLPVISGSCFAELLCDDKSSRFVRYEVFRTGYYRLKAAKCVSCMLSSGICTELGFAAFAAFTKIYFSGNFDLHKINFTAIMAEMFVLGIMFAVPGLVTAAFTVNKYLIVCFPFLLRYCSAQFSQMLSDAAYSDWQNPDLSLGQLSRLINPDSISSAFSYPDSAGVILLNIFIMLAGTAVYIFRKGGADKGE